MLSKNAINAPKADTVGGMKANQAAVRLLERVSGGSGRKQVKGKRKILNMIKNVLETNAAVFEQATINIYSGKGGKTSAAYSDSRIKRAMFQADSNAGIILPGNDLDERTTLSYTTQLDPVASNNKKNKENTCQRCY